MPMIALSPVWWSWQKTTCSWSARQVGCVPGAAPFSSGIANTLVTVATLLISFRFLAEPESEPSVLRTRGSRPGLDERLLTCGERGRRPLLTSPAQRPQGDAGSADALRTGW